MSRLFASKSRILIIFFILFVLLRIPSFSEPFWNFDEGLYATVANSMTNGKLIYVDIFDHKSPLIYFMYLLGNGTDKLFYAKLANLLVSLVGLIGFHQLLKVFVTSKRAHFIGLASFTLLFGSSMLEGNVSNTENYFVPIVIWALVFVRIRRNYFFAGILFALAFLFKFHPVLDFLAISFFILTKKGININKVTFSKLIRLTVGFAIPILASIFLFSYLGMLSEAYEAIFVFSRKYSVTTSNSVWSGIVFRTFIFIILLVLLWFSYYKKKLGKNTYLVLILLFCSIYAVFLSGRNFTHYTLQAVPYLSIGIAIIYEKFLVDNTKRLAISISLFLFSVVSLVVVFPRTINENDTCKARDLPPKVSVIEYYYDYAQLLISGNDEIYDRYFYCIQNNLDDLEEGVDKVKPKQIYVYDYIGWHYLFIEYEPPIFYFNPFHNQINDDVAINVITELKDKKVDIIAVKKGIYRDEYIIQLLTDEYMLEHESVYYEFYRVNKI